MKPKRNPKRNPKWNPKETCDFSSEIPQIACKMRDVGSKTQQIAHKSNIVVPKCSKYQGKLPQTEKQKYKKKTKAKPWNKSSPNNFCRPRMVGIISQVDEVQSIFEFNTLLLSQYLVFFSVLNSLVPVYSKRQVHTLRPPPRAAVARAHWCRGVQGWPWDAMGCHGMPWGAVVHWSMRSGVASRRVLRHQDQDMVSVRSLVSLVCPFCVHRRQDSVSTFVLWATRCSHCSAKGRLFVPRASDGWKASSGQPYKVLDALPDCKSSTLFMFSAFDKFIQIPNCQGRRNRSIALLVPGGRQSSTLVPLKMSQHRMSWSNAESGYLICCRLALHVQHLSQSVIASSCNIFTLPRVDLTVERSSTSLQLVSVPCSDLGSLARSCGHSINLLASSHTKTGPEVDYGTGSVQMWFGLFQFVSQLKGSILGGHASLFVPICCSTAATEVAPTMVSVDAFLPLSPVQFFPALFRILAMIRAGVQPPASQTTILPILGCWVGHPIVLDSCCMIYIYMYTYIYIYK